MNKRRALSSFAAACETALASRLPQLPPTWLTIAPCPLIFILTASLPAFSVYSRRLCNFYDSICGAPTAQGSIVQNLLATASLIVRRTASPLKECSVYGNLLSPNQQAAVSFSTGHKLMHTTATCGTGCTPRSASSIQSHTAEYLLKERSRTAARRQTCLTTCTGRGLRELMPTLKVCGQSDLIFQDNFLVGNVVVIAQSLSGGMFRRRKKYRKWVSWRPICHAFWIMHRGSTKQRTHLDVRSECFWQTTTLLIFITFLLLPPLFIKTISESSAT